MVKFNSGILSFTAGDTIKMTLTLYEDGVLYTMESDDTLTFTARKCYSGDVVIEKTVTGTNEITLGSAYTSIEPGTYIFDIKLVTSSGYESTVIGLETTDQSARNMSVLVRASE